MRSKVVRMLALALLLCGIDMIAAQQPGSPPGGSKPRPGGPTMPGLPKQKAPPEKSKLEEMLAEALKNNPDIRVAAAKLAEADAELNRTRLQVIQKIVTVYHAIETQKKSIAHQESICQALQKSYESGTGRLEVFAEAKQALTLAKGKLEELEAQMPALLGKTTRTSDAAAMKNRVELKLLESYKPITITASEWEWVVRPGATGPMSGRIRKALQTPVKVDYKDMTFAAILNDLSKKVEGPPFRDVFTYPRDKNDKMSFRLEEALPLSAVLQALADERGCVFFVRDYGIVATQPDHRLPGAITAEEFMREKPTEK